LHWRKLRYWVEDEREARLLVDAFVQAATLWDAGQHEDLLWGRRRLLLLQELMRQRSHRLEGAERRFFQASLWASRRNMIIGTAIAAAVAAGALFGGGAYLRLEAQRALAEAAARREEALRIEADKKRVEAENRALEAYVQLQAVLREAGQRPSVEPAVLPSEQPDASVSIAMVNTAQPPTMLDPRLVGKIEEYLAEQARQNEPVPEPLADLLTEEAAPPPGEPPPAALPPPLGTTGISPGPLPKKLPPGVAYAALGKAKQEALACRSPEGPHGVGKLALVLDPTGTVSSVVLDKNFAGTSIALCVDRIFRKVSVPPFEGKAILVTWSFNVP
jgi:hypothetical protein